MLHERAGLIKTENSIRSLSDYDTLAVTAGLLKKDPLLQVFMATVVRKPTGKPTGGSQSESGVDVCVCDPLYFQR